VPTSVNDSVSDELLKRRLGFGVTPVTFGRVDRVTHGDAEALVAGHEPEEGIGNDEQLIETSP
jgi:hypothetical protein